MRDTVSLLTSFLLDLSRALLDGSHMVQTFLVLSLLLPLAQADPSTPVASSQLSPGLIILLPWKLGSVPGFQSFYRVEVVIPTCCFFSWLNLVGPGSVPATTKERPFIYSSHKDGTNVVPLDLCG